MTFAVLKPKAHWTGHRHPGATAYTGRRSGRLPGGHIADLSDLKKGIILCETCVQKFNVENAEYVRKKNLPFVMGKCDGCNGFHTRQHFLVHHTLANLL